jgi:hypothetical protein
MFCNRYWLRYIVFLCVECKYVADSIVGRNSLLLTCFYHYSYMQAVGDNTWKLLFAICHTGVSRFLQPLVLISASNLITLVKIRTRKRIAQERTRQERNIIDISRAVISISIMHCISMSPCATFMYLQCSHSVAFFFLQFFQFLTISYFGINSGINFILYCVFGDYFRQDLKETFVSMFKCCRPLRYRMARKKLYTMTL